MLKILTIKFFVCCFCLITCWTERKDQLKQPIEVMSQKVKPEIAADQSSFSVDYLMGKFDPATHPDFIKIPIHYADQADRYLRKDAFISFEQMAKAAKKEGHKLVIKSATRNFENQKRIWENKWKGVTILEDNTKANAIKNPVDRAKKILLYSSMPGTSRHHWGTDIDINAFVNSYFEKGEGEKLYNWMQVNAAKYGFCQVYSEKNDKRINGYNEEKWHWSYMPIATQLSRLAKEKLKNEMIKGFEGSETATSIDMLNNYVLATNVDCL
jgi:zinc D-Ala-D-Ala carboxypeptidase